MIVVSFSVGMKLGRSSKSITKLPCSPQPALGVSVAEVAGNGLAAVALTLMVEVEVEVESVIIVVFGGLVGSDWW